MRGESPNSARNTSNKTGKAMYLANAGPSMLLNSSSSAGAALVPCQAARRCSASSDGR